MTDEHTTGEHASRPPWMPERPIIPRSPNKTEDELEAEAMYNEQELVHEPQRRNSESDDDDHLASHDPPESSASTDPGANYWTCSRCYKKNIPVGMEFCPICPAFKSNKCEMYEERQDSDEDGSSEQDSEEQNADEDELDEQAANDQQSDDRRPHGQAPGKLESGEHESDKRESDEQERDEPRAKRARIE